MKRFLAMALAALVGMAATGTDCFAQFGKKGLSVPKRVPTSPPRLPGTPKVRLPRPHDPGVPKRLPIPGAKERLEKLFPGTGRPRPPEGLKERLRIPHPKVDVKLPRGPKVRWPRELTPTQGGGSLGSGGSGEGSGGRTEVGGVGGSPGRIQIPRATGRGFRFR